MKKIILVFAMLFMLSTACLGLAGCDYTTGEIGKIDYDPESKTIYWEPVSGADNYTVFENGKRLLNTNDTKFPVSALKEDVSYITVAPTKYMKDTGLSEEFLFISKGTEGVEYIPLGYREGYQAKFLKSESSEEKIYVQSVYDGLPVKSVYISAPGAIKIIPDNVEIYEVYSPNGTDEESTVRLPQNVKEIREYPICKAFQINKYGKNFSTQDGVLYDNTMETLVYYPYYKKDSKFVVPESVKTILDIQNEYITEIKLPSNLKKIDSFPPNLKELSIPASVEEINLLNQFYGSKLVFEEGFKFFKAAFFLEKDCDVYLPESVIISEGAFCTNLNGGSNTVIIHCAAKEQPAEWRAEWQIGCKVIWGEKF